MALRVLYRHVMQSQRVPPYWPLELPDRESNGTAPVVTEDQRRKVIFPPPDEFAASPSLTLVDKPDVGAPSALVPEIRTELPPWFDIFWWGLRGSEDSNGTAISALALGQPQLERHVRNLAAVLDRSDDLTRGRLRAALDGLFILSAFLPLAGLIGQVVGQAGALKDFPTFLRDAREVRTPTRTAIANARTDKGGRVLNPDGAAQARVGAEQDGRGLARVSSVVPFVVVVDDAHRLDALTIAFLRALLRDASSKALVVLAVNTDLHSSEPADESAIGPHANQELHEWLAEQHQLVASSRAARHAKAVHPPGEAPGSTESHDGTDPETPPDDEPDDPRLSTITLAPLDDEALLAITLNNLGDAPVDLANLDTVIAVSHGLPGRLLTLLEVSAVRTALTDGGALPADLSRFTHQHELTLAYRRLPATVRATLCRLALTGPQGAPAEWLTAGPTGTVPPVTTTHDLATAIKTGFASTSATTQFVAPSSPEIRDVILAHVEADLTEPERHCVWTLLHAHLLEVHDSMSWLETNDADAESLLAAVVNDPRFGAGAAPQLVAELLRIQCITGRPPTTAAGLDDIRARLEPGNPNPLLLIAASQVFLATGHIEDALQALTTEYQRLVEKYSEKPAPATWRAILNLAIAHESAATTAPRQTRWTHDPGSQPPAVEHLARHAWADSHLRTAIGLLKDLVAQRAARSTPAHPDSELPHQRLRLAKLYAATFQYGPARDQAERAWNEFRTLPGVGPDHPDTLTARANLAAWTGEAGALATARDLYAALLPDLVRVLGPDHPHTLTARGNLAARTGETGDPATARDVYAALLPDMVRVLGPDHPHTLTTRADLALRTGEAGDPATSRDLFTDLLPDLVRVLGPDHPHTLTARGNLALRTGEAGDPATSRDLFTDLLPDLVRVLGPHHPNTLTARANLAAKTGKAGDPATARDLFTDLLPDMVRVLGPHHPNTLTTRGNQAAWTGEAGDPATARDLYAALMPDLVRVLGPHHPVTLTVRSNLAAKTGKAGDPATARDLYAALLPDMVRVLGPHHPDTVTARANLAAWTGLAGAPNAPFK